MTEKPRILVIDDQEAVRETVCENLTLCGYEVLGAADGDQGVRSIDENNPPHVVITDIIMPNKEGLETIMEIKKKYPSIKLIAISGGGRTKTTDFLKLADKFGADATMPKPLDMDELERIVAVLAGR